MPHAEPLSVPTPPPTGEDGPCAAPPGPRRPGGDPDPAPGESLNGLGAVEDPVAALRTPLPADPHAALAAVRRRTRALVAGLTVEQLERQVSPLMSPIVWDLAHIAAYEDLWLVHRHGDRPLLHPELAAVYDAFETPRAVRGEVELLDVPGAWAFLAEVRGRVDDVVAERGADPVLHELVLRHELQHTETILQALRLGDLAPWLDALPGPVAGAGELVEIDGGVATIGAGEEGFAYDNERPRHRRPLAPFRIARAPLTAGEWRAFVAEADGDRRWWSDEGWAWRGEREGPPGPPARVADDAVACHLSWFEAEALAAWRGLRLPTEVEWEHAAASGRLAGVGAAWEWTASVFAGYDGFRAHPYREYSEVFFDRGYRVLRGGSFAAHPRVASASFRNWDLPQRRQIFAGARLAGDLA
ncbi:SUMF1/EgtB/PvdO family nonheme iron enzyme [Patulibacter defluvii]|uniref:SUMF1/EgtB/PvdO family nonheme iron enzyme n=1 Tax=Patulibacter defluvii TaxID=3095358 RepID=UPI002A74915D|nr:SUMF1/EgtB/PvdO family nonheme iron enzyme [Patulibacter sp. DM4]